MTDYKQVIQPYNGDPFIGHLATPISASGFTKALINNLPAYRKGLSSGAWTGNWTGSWLFIDWSRNYLRNKPRLCG